MILIPEIETVVILPPRTASKSISRAVVATYPQSIRIYRHMEADGVPHGYDRWRKVGVVRHPIERLFSLYKYLQDIHFHAPNKSEAWRINVARAALKYSFDDWLIFNETVFTNPYSSEGTLKFYPFFSVLHSLPETKKSQWIYLRPDLGTEIFRMDQFDKFLCRLRVGKVACDHATYVSEPPAIRVTHPVWKFHEWEAKLFGCYA